MPQAPLGFDPVALFSLREVGRYRVLISRQGLVCQRFREFFHGLGVSDESFQVAGDFERVPLIGVAMLVSKVFRDW